MISTASIAFAAIGAVAGGCAGTFLAVSEKVGKKDNQFLRIAKIVSLALFVAVLTGTVVFGIGVFVTIKGAFLGITLLALLVLSVILTNRAHF